MLEESRKDYGKFFSMEELISLSSAIRLHTIRVERINEKFLNKEFDYIKSIR